MKNPVDDQVINNNEQVSLFQNIEIIRQGEALRGSGNIWNSPPEETSG